MFNGFDEEGFVFLQSIQQNNHKEWFEAHRQIYENKLLAPLRSLVDSLSISMQQIDSCIGTRPAVGRTISNLRRDTRFSHDKSPYRNNIWLTFKRPKKNWTDAPAFFFELGPDWWQYGLGYYNASPTTMGLFRERLLEFPDEFQQAIKAIPSKLEVHADTYKRQRIPEGILPDLVQWYIRKSFFIAKRSSNMLPLLSSDLTKTLIDDFNGLSKMYWFLMNVEFMKQ